MAIECVFSFNDLYKAAFGKQPGELELKSFTSLNQKQRNGLVEKWARQAGWQTKEKLGSDGKIYLAFAPKF